MNGIIISINFYYVLNMEPACQTYHCTFQSKKLFGFTVVYTEKTLLFANKTVAFNVLTAQFKKKFKLLVSFNTKMCLGIIVKDRGDTIKLDNEPVVHLILKDFNM